MKKVFLSLFAVAAIGLSANAQQVVKFGPKAGVNISSLSGEADTDMKVGFHVGAFAEIFFTDKFALQPELLYSAQGAKDSDVDVKTNLDFINIPIMAKYYVIDNLAVEAGPYVGFLMKAEFKGDDGSLDIKDHMNTVDFGLGIGANYNLDNGFFGGARYQLGLSDVQKDNNGDAVKNGVIQISVGYKF